MDTSRHAAALLTLAALSFPAAAQSISGNLFADARCAGDAASQPIHIGDDLTIVRHGECTGPSGIDSINDSSISVKALPGHWAASALASTDFRGTRDDAGSASASAYPDYLVTDIVFTNPSNPADHSLVSVSMNIIFKGHASIVGASNCNPFYPNAGAHVVTYGAFEFFGNYSFNGPVAPDVSGLFLNYPNDNSPLNATSESIDLALGTPYQFEVQLACAAAVLYCDSPPAAVGSAAASLEISLPAGPVFNLPPGITANSPSLGVVNNLWLGAPPPPPPCGAADFDGDGDTGTDADIESFFACLAGACCPTCDPHGSDFNGDGDTGTDADIESFFRVLAGGSC